MQRALATDGVEWQAADMTFDQTGRINAMLNRTKIWSGTGGVYTGGVVATVSGLTVSVSGPLLFHANGELGIVASPANILLANNSTLFVIAKYGETQDTPAAYYGGVGGVPNLHANETPTVIARTAGGGGAAVLSNGEVDLATVVTGAATITSIDNTTKINLPSCDNAGNLLLGSGKTIDGMDPSVHQALVATGSVLGHVKLGGIGGAAPYGTLGGAWARDTYYDVGSTFAASKLLDDSDFSGPPASSQPFLTTGAAYNTMYLPTRYGDLIDSGYGPRIAARYTLTFTALGVVSISMGILAWDDTIRVKANGTTLFSSTTPTGGSGQVVNFNTVIGTNTIQVYLCNGGGNQYVAHLATSVLNNSGFVFTG